MDLNVPTPNASIEKKYGYDLEFIIDGFFQTTTNKSYLHDIASRIAYLFNGTYDIESTTKHAQIVHSLSKFKHIERIPTRNAHRELNAMNGSRDEIWEALRYKAYEMKRSGTLDLEALITYGNRITNFSKHIKYLAKNVYTWTDTHYEIRESIMTRTEASIKATKHRADRTRSSVKTALKHRATFYSDLSDKALAKLFNISRTSFYKYRDILQTLDLALETLNALSTPYTTEMDTYLTKVIKTSKDLFRATANEITATANEIIIDLEPIRDKEKQQLL
jgi:hypothetical protein